MAKKRSVKVYGQSGYKYRETPTIMLKGMWLKEAGFDSITEDVSADGLDDIHHEFRSVGFNAFPFLLRANAFVGDGFSTELIGANPGLHM